MTYLGKTREPVMFFHADLQTIEFAKQLRKSMTDSERKIWGKIRRKRICGVKFRRQQPIDQYVADFYCHELRLVIEIDGSIHDQPVNMEHDLNRTARMDQFGIKVIRFTNEDITNRLNLVIEMINKEVEERSKDPTLSSSPSRGGSGEGSFIK